MFVAFLSCTKLCYMNFIVLAELSKGKLNLSMVKLFLLSVLLTTGLDAAWAEKSAASSPNVAYSAISKSQIKVKIDELNAKQGLDAAIKAQLLPLYESAQDYLTKTEVYTAKAAEFETAIKAAPEQAKKLQREIEQGQQKLTKQKLEDFTRISDAELEQRLILEKEKAASLDEQIKKLEKELVVQNDRPQQIRQETIIAQQALEVAQKKLETRAIPASLLETEARQIQQSALVGSSKSELKMLSAEANSNLIRTELLKSELQLLTLQKELLSPVISTIESVSNSRKQQEAKDLENELTQAEKTASGKDSLIIQTARDNIQYSRDLQAITGKIEAYNDLKNKVDTTASEIEADFKSAEKKISLAGLSPVLGKILREQRRNLANLNQFLLESEDIQNETALTSLEQFKIEDKLKQIADMDAFLHSLVGQRVDKALPASDRMMIQAELRVLLNNQKELLNKLSVGYSTYLRTLGDFDFAKQQMHTQANKFAGYLDERLLWVPSSTPINSDYLRGLYDSFKWLMSPLNWMALIKDIIMVALETPFLTFLALLGLVILPLLKNWAKQKLLAIADKIEKIYTDNFSNTIKALIYTLILVLPLPVFIYYLGWFLSANSHVANFSKAVGVGLQSIAIPLFVLQLFYRLFANDGIAIKHFQWQKKTANLLRKQIAWFRFIIIPGGFLINSTSASLLSNHSDNLGRLALIINMIATSVFFARLLNPNTGLLQMFIKAHPNDLFSKLRYVWFPLMIFMPLAVVGFAIVGYYLSALELQQKLIVTLRFIFCIVIIYGMVIRWLTLMNRQLALKNARQKRKSALTEKQVSSGAIASDDPVVPIDEELIDIPTINAQTIKLLIVFIALSLMIGLWLIWSNILPAFSFLEHIVLWQHPVIVDNQQIYQPITLTNLLRAGLYVFVVVVSVRNFSGLMELLVFSRLSVAAGGRYAVNQLARYLIITIGLICVANELGGSWSQVQWLVAALSVGLGFGLQEIFANLVSGIILLFERPIRVGDTVTINGITGKVSRIQMRATTIMDWDHKELIVPNKTFITNQLVNWTLSDTTTRIVLPISVANDNDADRVHKVMLEVARSTPLVLEEPAPNVIFAGIKENTLEFSVMVFVSELGHRLQVTHNLHVNLEKAFKENNIKLTKATAVSPKPVADDS
jgi:potassium-dependent mechanosensitive channel